MAGLLQRHACPSIVRLLEKNAYNRKGKHETEAGSAGTSRLLTVAPQSDQGVSREVPRGRRDSDSYSRDPQHLSSACLLCSEPRERKTAGDFHQRSDLACSPGHGDRRFAVSRNGRADRLSPNTQKRPRQNTSKAATAEQWYLSMSTPSSDGNRPVTDDEPDDPEAS